MQHTISSLCLFLSSLLLLSGCFESSETRKRATEDNILVVGTESNYPNFSFKQHNELVGFDIDIITEVAKRLGKKIEFKDMNFEALIPQVQLGTIPVVAAGMTPTEERKKLVSFTEPYIKGDPLFIVTLAHKGEGIKGLDDLKDKRVVVNQGYTADFFMSKIEGPELIRLETPAEAFLALQQNRADAFVTARNTLMPFFKKHNSTDYDLKVVPGTDESTALIVSKQYPQLLEEMQKVLHDMMQDGTIDALKKKWDIYV